MQFEWTIMTKTSLALKSPSMSLLYRSIIGPTYSESLIQKIRFHSFDVVKCTWNQLHTENECV